VIEGPRRTAGAAPGPGNTLSDVSLGDGAHLAHIKCTLAQDRQPSRHLLATLGKASAYRVFQLTAATALVRNNLFAIFAGEGCQARHLRRLPRAGGEHIDTTLVIDHAVAPLRKPRACSRAC